MRIGYLRAGAVGATGLVLLAMFSPATACQFAAGGVFVFAAYLVVLKLPKSNHRLISEVFTAKGYMSKERNLPVKVNRSDRHLVYELLPGQAPEDFLRQGGLQPYINSNLKAETDIYSNNGQLHIRVLGEPLPKYLKWEDRKP